MSDYKSNIWKIYLMYFLKYLHFFSAILVPFFVEWGGISFTKVMLLQSWFMISIFLFEVPTGAVADNWGRKQSLVLALIMSILAAVTYVSYPSFWIFMLAETFWALSYTLTSGAADAFIYDSLEELKETKKSKKIYGRLASMKLGAIMVSAPIGSLMAASFGLRAPMIAMVVPLTVALLIGFTLKEPKVRKKEDRRYWETLRKGMRYFKEHKILKILAFDMISIAVMAYFILWLYQPVLMQAEISIAYFGFIGALCAGAQILLINNYERVERLFGSKKSLLLLTSIGLALTYLALGISGSIIVLVIAIVLNMTFGMGRAPVFKSYFNKYIPSKERATILSTISMVEMMFIAAVSPIIGLLADWSLNTTLIGLGTLTLILALFSRVEEEHLID